MLLQLQQYPQWLLLLPTLLLTSKTFGNHWSKTDWMQQGKPSTQNSGNTKAVVLRWEDRAKLLAILLRLRVSILWIRSGLTGNKSFQSLYHLILFKNFNVVELDIHFSGLLKMKTEKLSVKNWWETWVNNIKYFSINVLEMLGMGVIASNLCRIHLYE